MPKANNVSYTFETTGESGEIEVYIYNDGSKSTYVKSIEVTYTTSGGGSGPYTVTYNANGGTGTLTDPNSPYQANTTVTVLANTFTKTGNTFFCWSDAQDGSGNLYDPADPTSNTFTINANTTLYAQWIPNTHTLTLPNADTYGSYSSNVSNPNAVAYGTTVNLLFTPNQGYNNYIATWSVNGTAISGNSFTMPDQNVTVTVAVEESSSYSKVTSANQLVPGKHYIIVGLDGTDAYAMGYQKSNNRNGESVTISNNTIQQAAGVYEFVISGPETIEVNDQDVTVYTIHDANVASTGFLYAASSGSNHLKTQSTLNDNGRWTITFGTGGKAVITAQGNYTRNLMRFNPGDPSNNIYPLFSCYGSETLNDIYLYVKEYDTDYEYYSNTTLASLTVAQGETYTVHSPAVLEVTGAITNNYGAASIVIEDGAQVAYEDEFDGTMLKNIAACVYSDQNNAGYNLITTPFYQYVPGTNANDGFFPAAPNSQNYDLYAYDATANLEWVNYKENNSFTYLYNYRGYLYANGEGTTLSYAGLLNEFNTVGIEGEVDLAYAAGNDDLKCFTLVGNPYTFEAQYSTYVVVGAGSGTPTAVNVLALNSDGDEFEIRNTNVTEITLKPLEAVLIYAPAANMKFGYDMIVSQHNAAPNPSSDITVSVSRANGDLLDNAVVSFNGSMMRKFYLSNNSTRVYFPVSNQDYAVLPAENEGEMPVNFKAKENGTYVISVDVNNIEMNYLHLIDNMTGADVDLLTTPSYTFNASTSDYAYRFRLVFSASDVEENTVVDNFAYYNGSEWVVTSDGTLEVVDVMGRVLSTETISGNTALNINQPTGIYMLRLVNGNSVRVQKIVVR